MFDVLFLTFTTFHLKKPPKWCIFKFFITWAASRLLLTELIEIARNPHLFYFDLFFQQSENNSVQESAKIDFETVIHLADLGSIKTDNSNVPRVTHT